MDWEQERFVKVYTRDTPEWLALSFDAQSLLLQLLRKVDRSGRLDLGRLGKKGVAVALHQVALWPRLETALDELVADGSVSIDGDTLLVPNFKVAQEARQSDLARKRAQREREQAERDGNVTNRDKPVTKRDPSVTRGHAVSHAVTPRLDETRREEREDARAEGSDPEAVHRRKAAERATAIAAIFGGEWQRKFSDPYRPTGFDHQDTTDVLKAMSVEAWPTDQECRDAFRSYFADRSDAKVVKHGWPLARFWSGGYMNRAAAQKQQQRKGAVTRVV